VAELDTRSEKETIERNGGQIKEKEEEEEREEEEPVICPLLLGDASPSVPSMVLQWLVIPGLGATCTLTTRILAAPLPCPEFTLSSP
jgi:hypothetical protein